MFICPSLASYFISNCVLSLNMSCLSLCTEVLRSVLLLVTVLTNTSSCYAYLHLIMQRATPLFTDLCCWLKELQLFLESLFFFYTISCDVHDWLTMSKLLFTYSLTCFSYTPAFIFAYSLRSEYVWLLNFIQVDMKSKWILFTFLMHVLGVILHDLSADSAGGLDWLVWTDLRIRSVDNMSIHWWFSHLIYFPDQTGQYQCHGHCWWTPVHCLGADVDHHPLFPGNVCQLWW